MRSDPDDIVIGARPVVDCVETSDDLAKSGSQVGSYRLLRKLGSGAMGEVWEANHQLLSRRVAVKLINIGEGDNDKGLAGRRLFEREAQVTARLTSRNTVEVYDFGVTDDGVSYYVMELLDGIDLSDAVKRLGPMPPARAAHILTQVCCSLAEAHDAGVVHRDIKPANIFLARLGIEFDVVKVLDFGIASELFETDKTGLTPQNAPGTPSYISPEAAMGTDQLSGKADIYSLGCVAYWLLTAERVFEAPNSMAVFMKHLNEAPTPPTRRASQSIPADMESLVMACMAKDPDDRPSALQLWSSLLETGLPQQWGTVVPPIGGNRL